MKKEEDKKFYLIGAGIASLGSAAYLIRDGHIAGKNITIFDESDDVGGSLDAKKFSKNSYVMRGYRMFEKRAYACTFDLMSFIPSLKNSAKTIKDEFFDFNRKNKVFDRCRLIENGMKVQSSNFGLNWKDKEDLVKIMVRSEASLGNSKIKDNFRPEFFKTNYWYEVCTTFAFEPWHSAAEFRRYLLRYMHTAPYTSTLTHLESTPYNQYESLILPLLKWLEKQGVHFERNSRVFDLDFEKGKRVKCIYYTSGSKKKEIAVGENDYVFATVGSMTANSANGSMDSAPKVKAVEAEGSWKLWKNIAKKHKNFGRPSAFGESIDKSKFEGFTITFQDSELPNLIKKFTGNDAGHGGIITFKDSNWLMSMIIPRQPYFLNQKKNLTVCWGYGFFPDRKGNYIQKKMSECTGGEILIELLSHFGFKEDIKRLGGKAICIPTMLPYATSQFLPRKKGDRPQIVPKGSKNIAFIGQFCEVPDEITFTIEYSVRSAQMAVYSLLGLHHKIPPIYQGKNNIKVLYRVAKTMIR